MQTCTPRLLLVANAIASGTSRNKRQLHPGYIKARGAETGEAAAGGSYAPRLEAADCVGFWSASGRRARSNATVDRWHLSAVA